MPGIDVSPPISRHPTHVGQGVGGTGPHAGLRVGQFPLRGVGGGHELEGRFGGVDAVGFGGAVGEEGGGLEFGCGDVVGAADAADVDCSVGSRVDFHYR